MRISYVTIQSLNKSFQMMYYLYVTFVHLRLCYKNTRTCFSKDAENLTTYNGYVL